MTGPNPTDRGKLGTKRHVLTIILEDGSLKEPTLGTKDTSETFWLDMKRN